MSVSDAPPGTAVKNRVTECVSCCSCQTPLASRVAGLSEGRQDTPQPKSGERPKKIL